MTDPNYAIHSGKVKAKPCPFCRNPTEPDLEFYFNGDGPPPQYAVTCGWCNARGPCGSGKRGGDHGGAKDQAIVEWNTAKRGILK